MRHTGFAIMGSGRRAELDLERYRNALALIHELASERGHLADDVIVEAVRCAARCTLTGESPAARADGVIEELFRPGDVRDFGWGLPKAKRRPLPLRGAEARP